MPSLKSSVCEERPSHLGQTNNVFLIVAITAIMAIVTAVLTFYVDMVTPTITGSGTQTAADALAIAGQPGPGH